MWRLTILVPLALLGACLPLLASGWVYSALGLAFLAGGLTCAWLYREVYESASVEGSWRPGFKSLADYASLKAMAYRLMGRASRTAIASAEVSHHADAMDRRLQDQKRSTREAAASMAEVATAISQVSASATQVAALAERAGRSSHQNHASLAEIVEEMNGVTQRSGEALALLSSLNERIDRVRNVTSVIDEIAEQTHLLSLNASIEAARAGEYGRGFAVVAGEVRNLAQKTSQATASVETLVGDMHRSAHEVVATMTDLMTRIGERATGMRAVGEGLSTITQEFDEVNREIGGVAEAMISTRAHSQTVSAILVRLEQDVDEGHHRMHDLAFRARDLMEAAEGTDGELAQQRLEGRHQVVYKAARETANRLQALFEKAISEGELSRQALFHPEYLPIAGTQPPLYRTGFDRFTDQNFPALQEPLLEKLSLAYAIACDRNGYVPTHNQAVSRTPTGDLEHDLAYCRSKRIFDDATGSRCGAHTQALLLQTYKRDTGEVMHDLSVPIFIGGEHWGGFRIGYRPETTLQSSARYVSIETDETTALARLARA
ncbi:methyl-accepting chemotaxis protein [Vreelandella malpeensis]|uniref:Methyl-accepting chemotaxis protein n=1 Tax=Vreelandella malpeensis TaxID=1172368 RepID=A0ABS8DTZ5_9GAMM|nr:methyl-accepting chemotaxis protein [Halomonas malpeensis]MCB8889792.1 methyl-accepting chemotaxis protein [Halomonas malpeensis]